MASQYLSLNGQLFPAEQNILTAKNRSFRYGDGLFETIHASSATLQFFDDHFDRLISGMNIMKMDISLRFTKQLLEREIIRVLNKNKHHLGARVRLSVFRNDGGNYTPETNTASYLIETYPLENSNYVLNKKGLTIGIYSEQIKPVNCFSALKSANAAFYVLAGLYSKEMGWGDCIILNKKENIVESVGSNVFIIKGQMLYTPSLNSGCLPGVMRKQILQCAKSMELKIFDDQHLDPSVLVEADEIFLTNAIYVIFFFFAYEKQRYYNTLTKKLIEFLNDKVFLKISSSSSSEI